jgi:glutamate carboxypeptidase
MSHLVNQLGDVDTNSRYGEHSLLNFGIIRGGSAYNTVPYECDLQLEIRSTDSGRLQELFEQVFEMVKKTAKDYDEVIKVREVTQRPVSGIDEKHWLVQRMESIHERLGVSSVKGPASSDSCAFLNADIPTLTIGLAEGSNKHRENEALKIDSIEDGQLQTLMGLIETNRLLEQKKHDAKLV